MRRTHRELGNPVPRSVRFTFKKSAQHTRQLFSVYLCSNRFRFNDVLNVNASELSKYCESKSAKKVFPCGRTTSHEIWLKSIKKYEIKFASKIQINIVGQKVSCQLNSQCKEMLKKLLCTFHFVSNPIRFEC